MKKINKKYSFYAFMVLWLKLMNFNPANHQKQMSSWLEKLFYSSDQRKGLLMAFRNSGKSTIVGLFVAWILYFNPNLRILVLAADYALARKMVRNVKRIIEKHPLTSGLKPNNADEWASTQFTVSRSIELRDPSVLAKGIDANITGLRADIIICDDVEVPKNCDTAEKRKQLRDKLSELEYILSPDGLEIFIGTPHTFYTIYQTTPDASRPEADVFLQGYNKLQIPILDDFGNSAWPQRFSNLQIANMRRMTGENKFLSQMMLCPVNINNSRLNVSDLVRYQSEIKMFFANGKEVLNINNTQMISASCWWDPAFSTKGDNSVVACVFCDALGRYYLHDILYINIAQDCSDKALAQVNQVIDFLQRNHIPSIRIETNGLGKFLPAILRQQLAIRHLRIAVIEETSHRNKQERILEAFEVPLASKLLHVSDKIWHTKFIEELRQWQPIANISDDGLDAVAGCILSEPVRLVHSFTTAPSSGWQKMSGQFRANSNFKI